MAVDPEVDGRIRRMYVAFNARDTEAVLAELSPDIAWANAFEGGHVQGFDGIRGYWSRQWSQISPHVEPQELSAGDGEEVVVRVHQVVRSLDGSEVLDDAITTHRFRFTNGLISRFDVEDHTPDPGLMS